MANLKLDSIDVKILAALQADGQMTKAKLSEAVGLSASPCWERVKKLEKAGIISGYRAMIDVSKIVRHATILVEITLKQHRSEDFQRFEKAVQDIPEVVECYAIGGGADYVLKVMTGDIDRYQRLVDEMLVSDIGIDRYFTYIVTKNVKNTAPLPITTLLETP